MEIMESGHLRKIDHMGEAVPVLELFTNIWGAGAKTAKLWYQQVRISPCALAGVLCKLAEYLPLRMVSIAGSLNVKI